MSARDVIAEELEDEFGHYADERAVDILSALAAAGYRLIGPEQLDRETIERCVSTILEWTPLAQDNCDIRIAMRLQDAAAALRSLQGGDGDA